jgi:hypothetical protein
MGHLVVALNRSRLANDTVVFAQSIANALTGNPWFPSTTPALPVFEAHLADLAAAQPTVLTRAMGNRATRDEKLRVVVADLNHLKACVQLVADENPESAAVIIASAGMSVKRVGRVHRGELEARRGNVSGTARLIARCAGDRASYEFQYSTDQKTWIRAPLSLRSKITLSELTVGLVYYFRVRVVTKDGPGSYSQVVSLLVA